MEGTQPPADAGEASWAALPDDQLLHWRICDLNLRIEGSELDSRVTQLHTELDARSLPLKPVCYLGDEWFSTEGLAAIAIPFYLAHPRLKALENRQMLEVEGGTHEWCMMLLRHECGHAYDHVHQFSTRRKWRRIFGSPSKEYTPETYRPRPYSKRFVRHLPNWYAQAHPDEDFAETFAVWLTLSEEQWRARYRGWRALEKIEYVDELMAEAKRNPLPPPRGRRISDASKLRKTLARHYAAKKKLFAEDFPDFFDSDLRAILGNGDPGADSAAQLLRRHRKGLIESITRWTGQHKYAVDELVRQFIERCEWLELTAPRDQSRMFIDLGTYLASLVTNHLHTGRFKRSV